MLLRFSMTHSTLKKTGVTLVVRLQGYSEEFRYIMFYSENSLQCIWMILHKFKHIEIDIFHCTTRCLLKNTMVYIFIVYSQRNMKGNDYSAEHEQ